MEPLSGSRRWRAMDDKSLNLWRQIEGARRAERRQPADRAAPLNSTAPTRDMLTG